MDKHIDLNTKKEIQYSILKEYARYCDDNDLQYFLAYGTLLGAIRHSGYIPWDDDIDVMMPYSDFVKFIDNYSNKDFYVSHCTKDSSSWIPYCRLYPVSLMSGKPADGRTEDHIREMTYIVNSRAGIRNHISFRDLYAS